MSIENQIKTAVKEAITEIMAEQIQPILSQIDHPKKYYSVKELATHLGFSQGKVRSWYHLNLLPGIQIDGKIIFNVSDIDNFLEKHKNLKPH